MRQCINSHRGTPLPPLVHIPTHLAQLSGNQHSSFGGGTGGQLQHAMPLKRKRSEAEQELFTSEASVPFVSTSARQALQTPHQRDHTDPSALRTSSPLDPDDPDAHHIDGNTQANTKKVRYADEVPFVENVCNNNCIEQNFVCGPWCGMRNDGFQSFCVPGKGSPARVVHLSVSSMKELSNNIGRIRNVGSFSSDEEDDHVLSACDIQNRDHSGDFLPTGDAVAGSPGVEGVGGGAGEGLGVGAGGSSGASVRRRQ